MFCVLCELYEAMGQGLAARQDRQACSLLDDDVIL